MSASPSFGPDWLHEKIAAGETVIIDGPMGTELEARGVPGVGWKVWYGDPDRDHGLATLEGGDVMPIGAGAVLVGMGERSSRQAVTQLALSLLQQGAATRVVGCLMPKSRSWLKRLTRSYCPSGRTS